MPLDAIGISFTSLITFGLIRARIMTLQLICPTVSCMGPQLRRTMMQIAMRSSLMKISVILTLSMLTSFPCFHLSLGLTLRYVNIIHDAHSQLEPRLTNAERSHKGPFDRYGLSCD